MAGIGRKADFGKSEFDMEQDVENRLDTTDPFMDEALPFEAKVRGMMDRGMSEKEAVEWIKHSMEDARNREYRKIDILQEQSAFRKVIGDLERCTPVDESCVIVGPEDVDNAPTVFERQKKFPM